MTGLALAAVKVTLLVLGVIYAVRAFDSLRLASLAPWHLLRPEGEFRAGDSDDWDAYLAREAELFRSVRATLATQVLPTPELHFSRYLQGGTCDPAQQPIDWNRSYELEPDSQPALGAVLLVHGLSDSPYSLRSMAELYAAAGYHVVGLRLPGHGTVPGGLVRIRWRDWTATVELAVERAHTAAAGGPLVLVGYSCGGALVTRYAAEALQREGLPRPDQLVLFSPAVGITELARAGDLHRFLSWTPMFKRFAWQDIEPEYDPYKYNSFPKRAGHQMHALARDTCAQLARIEAAGRVGELPPVLAFQSLADATVHTDAVIDELFGRLASAGSELVLFDANQSAALRPFVGLPDRSAFERALADPERGYQLTHVVNRNEQTNQVQARSYPPGRDTFELESLEQPWPDGVYSLSHVAMPFAPDDPNYGHLETETTTDGWNLGTLAPRGERGLLEISADDLLRLRHNPFYGYLETKVRATLIAPD